MGMSKMNSDFDPTIEELKAEIAASGSYKSLLRMLEDAFEAGFSAGFYSEDNPADSTEDWEEYKREIEENSND